MNKHQSLVELYASLCGVFRAMEKLEKSGQRLCEHCTKQEEKHINGGRCNWYETKSFKPMNADEREKVNKTLELVEQIAEVNGWELS